MDPNGGFSSNSSLLGGGPRNCDEGSWVLMPLCLVVDFAYVFLFTRAWFCVVGDCRETNLGKRVIMPGLILVCNWCKGCDAAFRCKPLCHVLSCQVVSCYVTS